MRRTLTQHPPCTLRQLGSPLPLFSQTGHGEQLRLPEWRAGANAKGAREGARRPRRGAPAGPVARASLGGVELGPWSARGGCVNKAGRARETPRGTAREGTRKGSDERREWRRERARRERARGWALIPKGFWSQRGPTARRACWESRRAVGPGRARGKDADARRIEGV